LVQRSGQLGLEAFLPAPEQRFPGAGTDRQPSVAHLPQMRRVRSTEQAALFAADSVANATGWAGRSQRDFAMRLLQRYTYGETRDEEQRERRSCGGYSHWRLANKTRTYGERGAGQKHPGALETRTAGIPLRKPPQSPCIWALQRLMQRCTQLNDDLENGVDVREEMRKFGDAIVSQAP
jgi:hypothetical protein